MLLIYGDEEVLDESEREQYFGEFRLLTHEIQAAGQYRFDDQAAFSNLYPGFWTSVYQAIDD
jgi:hypothetical protein